jgi:hypothetical protein
MNRDDFDNLYGLVPCHNGGMPASTKLSLTLRWITGGSYPDISLSHYLSISSFYYILDRTMIELNAILKVEFKFNSASAICPGSTHDSTAFAMSSLSGLRSYVSGLLPGY